MSLVVLSFELCQRINGHFQPHGQADVVIVPGGQIITRGDRYGKRHLLPVGSKPGREVDDFDFRVLELNGLRRAVIDDQQFLVLPALLKE